MVFAEVIETDVGVIAPKVKVRAPAVLTAETPFAVVTELTKVPEVGRVTEVAPVVRRESALVGEKVTTSPPPRVIELVAMVEVSETVSVLETVPPAIVKPVPAAVRVRPLTDVGVMAPSPIVNLGVVVVLVQVAVTPLLAAAVSTEVTVPVAAGDQEVTPAPSVVNTLVLEPLLEGNWKMMPAPAAVLTLMIPEPEVAPFKVNCPPVPPLVPEDRTPLAAREVPFATPIFGVIRTGLVSTTNFVPVPV